MLPRPASLTHRGALPAVGELRPILAMTARHFRHDMQRVAVPHVEAQLVVRFGPTIPGGLDIHAMGVRPTVQRKFIRGGQHAVLARLQPGTYERALGISASELTGRMVPLEDLWTRATVQALQEQLASAADANAACGLLDAAVSTYAARNSAARAASPLLHVALEQLQVSGVTQTARTLGISERQLRRILHDALGIGPKTFSRLMRFEHAVRAAQSAREVNWSNIAVDAGYYDQAHLIADFHAIAGNTPRMLMTELMQS
ncbi:AraC family transcriptional regulator [Luteimonas terrae]|uniref:AraC family transcriptional regulator n=1 Tax=Luteimonas terrae TaxID=1530191 RepID=UPI00286B544D|nr:helix-turn-helix domain-containing protein [Luteimonas terrae]